MVTINVYEEPSLTELEITRDKSNVYLDSISDKKTYTTDLKLIKLGTYKIFARTKTEAGVVDIDTRYLDVVIEEGIDYGMVLLMSIAIIIVLVALCLFRPLIDNIAAVIAVIYPLTAMPQVLKIWIERETRRVSIKTWLLFLVFQLPLVAYAIHKRDKRLMVMWGIWCIVYLIVIIGVIVV